MMSERLDAVTIPKWGIEMTHGTIVTWHKKVGDTVAAGEEIVDIETDKIVNSFFSDTKSPLFLKVKSPTCEVQKKNLKN